MQQDKLMKLISDAETGSTTNTYEKELETLYKYLNSDQINVNQVRRFVKDNNGILDAVSHTYRGKSIVQIACSNLAKNIVKEGNLQVLRELISAKNLFYFNKAENCKEAIHYAAISCEDKILQTIIEAIKEDKENVGKINATTADGETALVLILKKRANRSLKCVEILLNATVDINATDNDNNTAILLACKKLDNYAKNNDKGISDIIKIIILLVNNGCDLDSHNFNSMTARDYIQKYRQEFLNEITLPPSKTLNKNTCQYLFGLLKEGRENDFLNHPLLKDNANFNDNTITLLQLACAKGYKRSVHELLKFGADPNVNTKKNDYPLEIAGKKGHIDIFSTVLSKSHFNASRVLLEITKNLYRRQDFQINHEKCLERLLKHKPIKFDVNYKDQDGSTPLHCSTKNRKLTASLKLLKAGALLSEKNNDGEMPVQDIDIGTLEKYFDYCIHYKQQRIFNNSWLTDDEKKEQKLIEINYTTLLPKESNSLVSHMEVIDKISKKAELTTILKHPYISSFLYLKWHRIRWFHYVNIIMYFIFCLLLYTYIFVIYLKEREDSSFFPLFLGFITVLLIGREIMQFVSRPKHYCLNFENWMELILFTISFVIIVRYPPDMTSRKPLASFAIIISAFELVLSLGQVPMFSTYVKMLRQVSWNFIKFILWQVMLLLGFALSFYILFSDAIGTENFNNNQNASQKLDNNNQHNISNNNEELDMFQNVSFSIVKTMVMLTGEFDASSIKFQLYPVTSILIFLAFVFMISMVVFNLLNGLAISDIQKITDHAEIVANKSRLNYMLMLENLFEKIFETEKFERTGITKIFYEFFFELIYSNSKFIKNGVALINGKGMFLTQTVDKNDKVKRQELNGNEGVSQETVDMTGSTKVPQVRKNLKICKKLFGAQLDIAIFDKIRHLLEVTKIEERFSLEQQIIKKQEVLEHLFKECMKEHKSDMEKMEERIFAVVKDEISKMRQNAI